MPLIIAPKHKNLYKQQQTAKPTLFLAERNRRKAVSVSMVIPDLIQPEKDFPSIQTLPSVKIF